MSAQLPNAVQIATERVRDMPTDTIEQRLAKSAAMIREMKRAKDELQRGEWRSE